MELLGQRARASVTLLHITLPSSNDLDVPPTSSEAKAFHAPSPAIIRQTHGALNLLDLCQCDERRVWKCPAVCAPECCLIMALICIALILDFGFAI